MWSDRLSHWKQQRRAEEERVYLVFMSSVMPGCEQAVLFDWPSVKPSLHVFLSARPYRAVCTLITPFSEIDSQGFLRTNLLHSYLILFS